ncbi:PspC domain-containing protein [Lichenicoccus roseus]|uniref:PspC domain-containing protein n=1 Tax=Lichenicoccus roseus TaxID=2683649 RepID=A0A5R9J2J8_9PROT|nr:PspC domain-containing protein [Lichenicoccus roseus]TLU71860.1 PspC domain-containing protein [Lichenicoccus roseus]
MNQDFRVWRQDRGAMFSGVCSGLAEDLDLPLPLLRLVAIVFLVLPTGLAYLALSLLMRRRPARNGRAPAQERSYVGMTGNGRPAPSPLPSGSNLALLAHRFERIEPRLKQIEAFVTSKDFELHRDFRHMGE